MLLRAHPFWESISGVSFVVEAIHRLPDHALEQLIDGFSPATAEVVYLPPVQSSLVHDFQIVLLRLCAQKVGGLPVFDYAIWCSQDFVVRQRLPLEVTIGQKSPDKPAPSVKVAPRLFNLRFPKMMQEPSKLDLRRAASVAPQSDAVLAEHDNN